MNTILFQLIAVMFMVPNGLQSACCAIIGEQIGANSVQIAKQYFRMMSITTIVLLFILQGLIYGFRSQIVSVFTSDPDVQELAENSVYIIVIAFTFDMIQGTIQGVIRALAIQKKAGYYALACYYILGIPFSILFVFALNMRVVGLWAGISIGLFALAIVYVTLVLVTDW